MMSDFFRCSRSPKICLFLHMWIANTRVWWKKFWRSILILMNQHFQEIFIKLVTLQKYKKSLVKKQIVNILGWSRKIKRSTEKSAKIFWKIKRSIFAPLPAPLSDFSWPHYPLKSDIIYICSQSIYFCFCFLGSGWYWCQWATSQSYAHWARRCWWCHFFDFQ